MFFENQVFAEVILPLPLEKKFHYSIPDNISHLVKAGTRVEVPFGIKRLIGYVSCLVTGTTVPNIKSICSVLDNGAVISGELFALALWISENYLCSIGEALTTIFPQSIRPPKRIISGQIKNADPSSSYSEVKQVLTPQQKIVADQIGKSIEAGIFQPFLLHGVTSSGKTEVYLSAIERTLGLGKSAIFLLPEISLTPQFINIVQKRFLNILGIWHSHLSVGEKYRTWDSVRNGRIKIILGARSAVFAPFEKLGLIVIDEEHEPSYKQDQKPSYLTRDVAIERARLNNAVVILGSATPSLETYLKSKKSEIELLELNERIDSRPLPPVRLLDLSGVKKKSKVLTEPMVDALKRILARREQAIIFLNRRGFSPGVICHDCGKIWQCPNCSISMVFHRNPEGLRCHYCDHKEPFPSVCPACKNKKVSMYGTGTQKVEEELKNIFPQARIFRLDKDTASKKGTYKKIYDDFRREDVDILIGTQMVVKGFDFPRVSLVGVVDADTALNLPDFRSAERTFQLITQVAGRAGRSKVGGEVIVQTYHPEHYALDSARRHDYKGFYEKEMVFRKQMNYPPFCRLVNILIRGKKEEKVEAAANNLQKYILDLIKDGSIPLEVLGPSPAARNKLYNQFRWQLLLKGKISDLLSVSKEIRKFKPGSGIIISIDVDPHDIL